MYSPPDLLIATFVNFIMGGGGAYATVTLIPAPPAGSRLRIWAMGLGPITAVTVPSQWHVYWRPIGDPWRISQGGSRDAAPPPVQLPGGIALAEAQGWEVTGAASGAGRTFPAWTAYTIEEV